MAGCTGKHRFVSPALARRVLYRNSDPGKRETYRCDFCGGWHIGGKND